MRQISARYDTTAAFLSVEVKKLSRALDKIQQWRKGKKTQTSNFRVFYRSKEEAVDAPFIMSIEG